MSQSNRLRRSHTDFGGGAHITSDKSTKQEKCTVEGVRMILDDLRRSYPTLTFRHDKQVRIRDFRPNAIFDKTSFKPDGGLIFAVAEGRPDYCVLISEAKHQGTNDKRLAEGKGKQSRGNAIERIFKNTSEANRMLLNWGQKTFPYVAFVSGNDFCDDSSIRDRVGTLCGNDDPNTVYVTRDADNQYRASLFVRELRWSADEVYRHGMVVATEALKHLPI